MPIGKRSSSSTSSTSSTSNAHANQTTRDKGASAIGFVTWVGVDERPKVTILSMTVVIHGFGTCVDGVYSDEKVVSPSDGSFIDGKLHIKVRESRGEQPTHMTLTPGTVIRVVGKYFKGQKPTVKTKSYVSLVVGPKMDRWWMDGVNEHTGEEFKEGDVRMYNGEPSISWTCSKPTVLTHGPPIGMLVKQMKQALSPKMVDYTPEIRYKTDGSIIPNRMNLPDGEALVIKRVAGRPVEVSWNAMSEFAGAPVEYTDERNFLKMAVNLFRVFLTLQEDGSWHAHLVIMTSNNMVNYNVRMNEELYEKFGAFIWDNFYGSVLVSYPGGEDTNRADLVRNDNLEFRPTPPNLPEELQSESVFETSEDGCMDIEWDQVTAELADISPTYDWAALAYNTGAKISHDTLMEVQDQFKRFGPPIEEPVFSPNKAGYATLNDLPQDDWCMVQKTRFVFYAISLTGEFTNEQEFKDHVDGLTDIDDILLIAVRKEYDLAEEEQEVGDKRSAEDEAGESSEGRRSRKRR